LAQRFPKAYGKRPHDEEWCRSYAQTQAEREQAEYEGWQSTENALSEEDFLAELRALSCPLASP
jgi:hypothetical protein